jgi:hypothetical protein
VVRPSFGSVLLLGIGCGPLLSSSSSLPLSLAGAVPLFSCRCAHLLPPAAMLLSAAGAPVFAVFLLVPPVGCLYLTAFSTLNRVCEAALNCYLSLPIVVAVLFLDRILLRLLVASFQPLDWTVVSLFQPCT